MKTIFGWLCDPYVHVIGIALILGGIAVPAGDERGEPARRLVQCKTCLTVHESRDGICRVTPVISRLDPHE
jgi:hypothetical protein